MSLINSGTIPTRAQEGIMAELNEYDVEVNGYPTTLKLTEEDAAKRGLKDAKRKAAVAPANKAARPAGNK